MALESPAPKAQRRFRSRDWFDDPKHIDMVALYLERFMNYGLTAGELLSGKPIIGIAQSGSDLNPCNRIHLETVKRVREGVREAGGIAMEFPVHPIFENCRRPTAALDRNLAYLGLVEILHGYPLDAVVLTTGCDKTTPAQVMAATALLYTVHSPTDDDIDQAMAGVACRCGTYPRVRAAIHMAAKSLADM